MAKFTIFQNDAISANTDLINELGWGGAAKAIPAVAFHLESRFNGSEIFYKEALEFYKEVAIIEAEDLEEAFDIGNIGPEEKITRTGRMSSISVGDIVKTEDGTYYMVNNFGWGELNV